MFLLENQRLRKLLFYSSGALEQALLPDLYFQKQLERKLSRLSYLSRFSPKLYEDILTRVAYYNKLLLPADIPLEACRLAELSMRKKSSYFYDFRRLMRHYPKSVRTAQQFGDVRTVSDYPCFVKTRPIHEPNENSVLLRLNSIRHFRPITDKIPFQHKKDGLVWRGKVKRDHRCAVFQKHFNHPLCDLGKTNILKDDELLAWNKPFMSVHDQLNYKFILSIEGNEVATNLKWIAQSNSLCFMTRPNFESWFMEGTLKDKVHFVELRDDYADLPEKLDYYLAHPAEAEAIIRNFNSYHRRFSDLRREELIGLLVVRQYLQKTGQLTGAGISGISTTFPQEI
jgi:hypothetical protein